MASYSKPAAEIVRCIHCGMPVERGLVGSGFALYDSRTGASYAQCHRCFRDLICGSAGRFDLLLDRVRSYPPERLSSSVLHRA